MPSAVVQPPADVRLEPARALAGELRLPGDKSISHRALMLALLAEGTSTIRGAGDGADVRSTAGIVAALGAEVARLADEDRNGADGNATWRVTSPGRDGLREPAGILDCGNSGTSMRLFAGILAGLPFVATLDGDASLRGRPMGRVIEPLAAMGADIAGSADGSRGPLTIRGRRALRAIDWRTPVPSAQVKSAVLLAALAAEGTSRVRESVATRDHTERMLRARGIDVIAITEDDGTNSVALAGPRDVAARDETVPGDPSAGAFWLVAASIHPDASLALRGMGANPTRRAVVDVLTEMGADIDEQPRAPVAANAGVGEPIADLVVRSAALRAIDLPPAVTTAAIDEIPILCLAATQARGTTRIRGVGELRHKESDRVAGIVDGLRAFGARISAPGDDLVIDGPTPLHGAVVDARGDHRLALTFSVAALIADGATVVHDSSSAGISYPTFFLDLERIRT